MREQRSQRAAPKRPKEDAIWGNLSNHWRRNAHHAEPEQALKLCREALNLLQEEGEIVSPFRDNLLRRIPSLHLPR